MEHEPVNGEPRNPHVHHEPGDVNAIFLTKFGIGMALMIVVFLFGLFGLFSYFKTRVAELAGPAGPQSKAERIPPEPRLQPADLQAHPTEYDPAEDMQRMRKAEDARMNEYAWVDPDRGIVRIPIARAMELVLQNGLPATVSSAQPSGKRP